MKILKIFLKNIHSLQDEHCIDFTQNPFNHSGLFAITGPTGSGKSTLLDAMVLALFNKIPRFNTSLSKNSLESIGGILTRGQKEAEASVTYECPQGIYQSVWRISTNRNGNLRDYEMEVFEMSTGKSLVEKKSEVPAKNEALIGLTYDQFIKSVLLAQGAFAEFLKADKNHRSELLEKITGTDIYRRLGMRIYQKSKEEFRTELEFLQREQNNEKAKQCSAEEWDSWIERSQTIEQHIQQKTTEEKQLFQQIEHQQQIVSEEKEQKQWSDRKKLLEENYQNFLSNEGKILERHLLAEPYYDPLKQWHQLQKEQSEFLQQEGILVEQQSQLRQQKLDFHKEVVRVLQKEVEEDKYAEAIRIFEKQIRGLQEELQEISHQYKALSNEVQIQIRPLEIPFDTKKPTELSERLSEIKKQSEPILKEFEEVFDDNQKTNLEEFQQKKESEKYQLSRAESDSQELKNAQQQIEELTSELSVPKEWIQSLPDSIEKGKLQLEITKKSLIIKEQEKEQQQLRASLEEHRTHLKEGEECPLCGALEHPFAKMMKDSPQSSELAEEIRKLQQQERSQQKELTQLQVSLENHQKTLKNLQEKIQQKKKWFEQKYAAFQNTYPYDWQTDWQDSMEAIEQEIQQIKTYRTHQNRIQIVEEVLPKVQNLIEKQEIGKEKQTEKNSRYSLSENIEEWSDRQQNQWLHLKNQQQKITEKQSEIANQKEENQQQFEQLQKELQSVLESSPFDTIASAFESLLTYEKAQSLKNQKEHFTRDLEQAQNQLKSQTERLEKLYAKGAKTSLEELQTKQNHLQQGLTQIQKEKEEIQLKINTQKTIKQRIEELSKSIHEQQQKGKYWQILNEMVGDATGKKFNTIAQDLTLVQLLSLANKRLQWLSKRYLIGQPEKEENELFVIDQDMGSERRSVKTLSGGETFVVSLALALALSDLASENVKIQSLFIDEGFGTLDPETLDQTLDTLERLQQEDAKMIGIISHIDSLKERIATQIQLVPNGRGHSSIYIQG